MDLRGLPLVTIDGEDAKDFDDAVYAEPHAEGFRLIVAIADVSYYVRRGTALDASARERGTSVYFPTRVIPMLPFALSNVLCSLQPKVDRLCFAADMIVSRTGQLLDAHFYPAVMRSAARLTYTQAFAALFEGRPEVRAELGPLTDKLLPLLEVYRALLKARHKRGALEFDAAEAEFDIDAAGRIQRVYLYERNEAHKLIEECMILANVAVARELGKRGVGTLYRVHGKPEEKKLNVLLETLNALGRRGGAARGRAAARFPRHHRSAGTFGGAALHRIADRAFDDAGGLPAAEHRALRAGARALRAFHLADPSLSRSGRASHAARLLSNTDPYGARYDGGQLAVAGAELTQLEKRADESDRYVSAWLKCVYLRDRIGQTFEGLITTVVEFGAFVQLTAVGTDGLLHIDNLRDDEYRMEPGGRAWVGRARKRRLGMGARVHVIVTSVNPIEGLVDLALVEVEQDAAPRARRSDAASRRSHRIAPRSRTRSKAGEGSSLTEKVYGLHAVRALLTRHAERVSAVTIAEGASNRASPRSRRWRRRRARPSSARRRRSSNNCSAMPCTRACTPTSSRCRPGAKKNWSRRSPRALEVRQSQPLRAGARRRAGSAQPRRLPAHGRCLRRAGGGDPEGSRRAAERHGAQGRGRRRRDHAARGGDQSRAHACGCSRRRACGSWARMPKRRSSRTRPTSPDPSRWSWAPKARGLRQLTRETCDFLVRLPQQGAVESLNVSVATGMLLYEAAAPADLHRK